ncbi:uncharacterized protein LOC110467374 [Mizuhopecten yessoensis]|uniref:THD domain-containing protein n=1 Tax=Mizuhopecten yessoensis TaxID=6573 RepID=A0A210R1J9_MIZYE|nr:uncharacterized protein LOC110467374 [Mizuhopecten yessoensis]OWF54837.1 hypothetical protein KP79_PYT20823 [Mizuhopecten yessoensis]
MAKEVCKSRNDETMECCQNDLIAGKTVPRHVIRYSKYKTFLIISVLIFVFQSCILVYSVIQWCRRNRDIDVCPESARTIWIPHTHNGRHDNRSADRSNFYCKTLDHKLSHLIDFLVVTNRSTVPDKAQRASRIWPDTRRPATKILHYHATNSTRLSKGFQTNYGNEVQVLGDGSVQIQQDGVYCVYSIITFVHTPSDTDVPNDEYKINRSRHSNKAAILSSDTVGQTGHLVTETYRTIDLSGNFHLKKGDLLNLDIRNISAVYMYSFTPASFWGVYQIKPKTC